MEDLHENLHQQLGRSEKERDQTAEEMLEVQGRIDIVVEPRSRVPIRKRRNLY